MGLQELGFVGKVAPFFLKRVFGMRIDVPVSPSPLKQWIRRVAAVPQGWLARINQPAVFVEMQLCLTCSFLQTKEPFAEEAINRLYRDYRSPSYNRERIEYEPTYAAIAEHVGQDDTELQTRVDAATAFLHKHVSAGPGFAILDYGGADGKFLPRIEAERFVFEISDIEPIPGVTRIHSEADMGTYSLVQLAHVIEHVAQPLELVRHVAEKVAPGGYLYLETPQELSDAERAEFHSGSHRRVLTIHEHINSYCVPAVSRLIESAGLRLVAIEATPVNVGWASATHIRALGRRE